MVRHRIFKRFYVGDKVRVTMKTADSDLRNRINDKKGKTIAVTLTPEFYTIAEVYPAAINGSRREG